MRRLAALLAGVALVAAGCGGPDANQVVAQTAHRLGTIRSGVLTLHLLVTPRTGQPFGFELHGPFALRGSELPLARITYVQIANGRRGAATLVSDGHTAYAESNGRRLALSAEQQDTLRAAVARIGGGGRTLGLDDWFEHPHASDGGKVGGADTYKVSADLDVVAAANGLLALVERGARITGDDADRLRDAVRSSSFVLYTGKRDKLLRRLDMSVDLGLDVPADLRAALGNVVGARVDFELGVANPNGKIR